MDLYSLPESVIFGGRKHRLNADFRNILKIFGVLQGPFPAYIRWRIAAELFYAPSLAEEDMEPGLTYLAEFLQPGGSGGAGEKLLDWQTDASAIVAGVNAAAGQEIRSLPFVHWWTFLSWFHAMPPGELSTRVAIRQKRQKGQKLEPWEQEYYRENKALVDLKPSYSQEEREEMERLNALLNS
ncbi:MAG: hypothetical protein IKJ94_05000 [Oscillospiraceae bacterium]|nr:hypothetical protein [Oscillospiraceae bacterium]